MKIAHRAVMLLAIVACSSSSPSPPPPEVTCCPPSPKPECCMSLGGIAGATCPLTCDIPDPSASGWTLKKDSDGCMRWFAPSGPFTGCDVQASDAGPPDVAVYDPCEPVSSSSWTPPTMQSPLTTTACTTAQIDQFWDACLDVSSTQQTCSTFEAANKPCADCLVTQDNATKWGAFVCNNNTCEMNEGGCVAIAQGLACGQAVFATSGCEDYSCSACAASNELTELRYEQCTQEADGDGCRKYLDAECSPDAGDATTSACFTIDTKTQFEVFANVFCNP